jgi:hypothetical protein
MDNVLGFTRNSPALSCYKRYVFKKHNGPGIKYEVGICIRTEHNVWINGPFPAGNIYQDGLMLQLADWELVECDTGLQGCDRARIPDEAITIGESKQKSVVRGRHKNTNGNLKVFNALVAYFSSSW